MTDREFWRRALVIEACIESHLWRSEPAGVDLDEPAAIVNEFSRLAEESGVSEPVLRAAIEGLGAQRTGGANR